ncbi:hypothetical protein E3E27_00140 [Thermococcus sp. MV11]|nr:hypothetical protein [Thermococcus sp. MV11]
MREGLYAAVVLLAIAVFFAPTIIIGPVYLALVLLYLIVLYACEKFAPQWVQEAVSVVFVLTSAHLLMERLERWDVRLFLLVAVLATASALRRLKNEGRPNPDAR